MYKKMLILLLLILFFGSYVDAKKRSGPVTSEMRQTLNGMEEYQCWLDTCVNVGHKVDSRRNFVVSGGRQSSADWVRMQ